MFQQRASHFSSPSVHWRLSCWCRLKTEKVRFSETSVSQSTQRRRHLHRPAKTPDFAVAPLQGIGFSFGLRHSRSSNAIDAFFAQAQTHNELWEGRVASVRLLLVRSVCSTTKMIRINPFVATKEPSWLQTQDTSFLLQISSSIIYSLALSWHSKPTTRGFYLRRPKFSK